MKHVLATLLILALASTAFAEEKPLLERLVSKDEAVREAAKAEWKALPPDTRLRMALAGMRSEDPDVAWFCADSLDPWRLTLEELRFRGANLARNLRRYVDSEGEAEIVLLPIGIGAPELPAWFLAMRDLELRAYSSDLNDLHRRVLPEHIPALVRCLGARDPDVFLTLLDMLQTAALFTNQHREAAARGFLYARARIAAEKAGEPLPKLADFTIDRPTDQLPGAFRSLLRHTWGPGCSQVRLDDQRKLWIPPHPWLRRWAWTLTAGGWDDLELLKVIAVKEEADDARAWAVAKLAGMKNFGARMTAWTLSRGTHDSAAFAAAARARQGMPDEFLEILGRGPPSERLQDLALEVAPGALVRLWVDSREWEWSESPARLFERAAVYGLKIQGDATRLFVEESLRLDAEPYRRLDLFQRYPEMFDRAMLAQLLAEVCRALEHNPDEAWFGGGPPQKALGILEVRAPDLLKRFLLELAHSENEDIRDHARFTLVQIGAGGYGKALVTALLNNDEEHWILDTDGAFAAFGALKDDLIRVAMRARAQSDDRFRAGGALVALAAYHGLDPQLFPGMTIGHVEDLPEDAWTDLRTGVLAGDPLGALVRAYERAPYWPHDDQLAALGRKKDPRAATLFRKLRAERTRYWPATLGLALAGDAAARREFLGFLRDGRTVMLDDLNCLLVPAMDLGPDVIDLIVEKLESNCCLGFYMAWALGERFPTLDTEYDTRLETRLERKHRIWAWIDRHRGHLRWSRILGGWVPTN